VGGGDHVLLRRYGASPLHLLAHLALLPLAGWALLQILDLRTAGRVLLWLAGAVIAHDLVLLPLSTLLDRAAQRALPGSAVNYVRVPGGLALLLGLVFFGEISGRSDPAFSRASGLHMQGALGRWLLACAVLFAVAAVAYFARGRGPYPGSRTSSTPSTRPVTNTRPER
jgi:hypothetical protein